MGFVRVGSRPSFSAHTPIPLQAFPLSLPTILTSPLSAPPHMFLHHNPHAQICFLNTARLTLAWHVGAGSEVITGVGVGVGVGDVNRSWSLVLSRTPLPLPGT